MKARGWKLYDDDESAIANGKTFRVCYFTKEHQEKFLYYQTKEEAFSFVQEHPELDRPEIKDVKTCEYLYPKAPAK